MRPLATSRTSMTSISERGSGEPARQGGYDENGHDEAPGTGGCSIAGVVYGDIHHHGRIVLKADALVIGDVFADEVIVNGAVTGSVQASGLIIVTAGASVGRELVAAEFDIDAGACIVPWLSHRLTAEEATSAPAGRRFEDSAPRRKQEQGEWPRFVG